MRIFRHYSELPADARRAAVALGNFDGVHRGHRAIVEETRRIARDRGVPIGVLTFEPHPRSVFDPDGPSFRLSSPRTKARWIAPLGVDLLFFQHFDRDFARRTPDEFVRSVLVDGLAASHVVVGDDFRFGRDRQGTPDMLEALGRAHGFGVTQMADVIGPDGHGYSSSRIRAHLAAGRPVEAGVLLGHWWEIEGRVEPGFQRGRTIGFPTANLQLGDYLEPAIGVYAVRAGIDEGVATRWIDGVANLGRRPTVDGEGLLLEVHLFDFAADLYGRHLRVQLTGFIRPERKFASFVELKTQIARDGETARRLLADTPAVPPDTLP